MIPEEINIAIAEVCGRVRRHDGLWYPKGKMVGGAGIPNYYGDLNAMHEVESLATYHVGVYIEILMEISSGYNKENRTFYNLAHATAAQRAEAFLKTLNLWKEV